MLRRAHGLIAAALLAAAWLAAPADAAGLPTDGQAPTVDAAGVTGQLSGPTTANAAAAGAAVETTAIEASGSVQRVVAGSADAVVGTGAQPAVDTAIRDATVAAPPPAGVGAGPQRAPHPRAAGKGPTRPARTPARRADAPQRSGAPSPVAPGSAPPAGPVTAMEVAAASYGIGPVTGSAPAAPTRPPILDPVSSGNSSASGASVSLLFGGLAVLLTALCVAGSGLRRRLPSRRAMCWPAAFVPLLERPG